jgi:hypothetical protein
MKSAQRATILNVPLEYVHYRSTESSRICIRVQKFAKLATRAKWMELLKLQVMVLSLNVGIVTALLFFPRKEMLSHIQ